MNQDLPPQPENFFMPGPPEFPMKQLKRLHVELTRFEVFIQMTTPIEELLNARDKILKIYEVQELIEGYVIEENERVKKLKAK